MKSEKQKLCDALNMARIILFLAGLLGAYHAIDYWANDRLCWTIIAIAIISFVQAGVIGSVRRYLIAAWTQPKAASGNAK